MARILVTDGEQRAALAVVRALARAGHEVLVCSARRRSLAGVSRHCVRQSEVPDPLSRSQEFASAVCRLTADQHIDVLLPISEASLLAVLAVREAFGSVCIPFPDLRTVERVCDKAEVLARASALKIGVPAQYVLADPSGRCEPRFPVVVKPARSVAGADGSRMKTGATHAADAAAFAAIMRATPACAYPVLVQERIIGPGVGVFVLLWGGQLLASFGHRRIREKPPWGGVSVYRASAEVPANLLDASIELLRAFEWNGVAMVEYKIDETSGNAYLMEINGRFWGSLQLAIDAGVDFPALLVDAALGVPRRAPQDYKIGIRSRWWWGDVDHLVARLRHSRAQLALTDDAPGRARAIFDFMTACADRSRNEVFRLSDPAPALLESIEWLRGR